MIRPRVLTFWENGARRVVRCPTRHMTCRTRPCGSSLLSSDNQPKKYYPKSNSVPPIPAPTWSIASLELETQHAPVDRTVLQALAKRALIDLSQLDSSSSSSSSLVKHNIMNTATLQQDVGNMMHMMNQILEKQHEQQKATDDTEKVQAAMYDVPRNVHATPMRRITDNGDSSDSDATTQQVWDSLLAPKTHTIGGHSYFIISTSKRK